MVEDVKSDCSMVTACLERSRSHGARISVPELTRPVIDWRAARNPMWSHAAHAV